MRLLPVLPLLLCLPIACAACATGVDDGVTGGGTDTGGVVTDGTLPDKDTATDAAKDSMVVDAPVGDTRDATTSADATTDTLDGSVATDSTVADTGADVVVVDTAKLDTAIVDSSKLDTSPTDAAVGSLLISELQTRGSGGGNDEFIEIYNPGSTAVVFDSTWSIASRSAVGTCATNLQAIRYTGTGQVIGPHRHLLLTNNNSGGYDGTVVGDDTYSTGIVDAASVVLYQGSAVIDAVCFYFDTATLASLTACAGAPYTCEGTPVTNLPHNNATGTLSNVDVSIDRKPGGTAGNGTDTGDNASDFTAAKTSNPQNLTSPAVP
jgi:hypothetical protein